MSNAHKAAFSLTAILALTIVSVPYYVTVRASERSQAERQYEREHQNFSPTYTLISAR